MRDGILHHTGEQRASTLEGRIVATADRIAYINHDIDDAIRIVEPAGMFFCIQREAAMRVLERM